MKANHVSRKLLLYKRHGKNTDADADTEAVMLEQDGNYTRKSRVAYYRANYFCVVICKALYKHMMIHA